jgi:hypothetical protein
MSLPVTVYRWDDAGAPQLTNGKPSEIIDILRKCLVDGYGDKEPLGWSIPFEDAATFKIAFRNSTVNGSGGYFQLWSANSADPNQGAIYVRPAQSMTGLDTFVRSGFQQALSAAQSATKWVIIGTSAGFYFNIGLGTSPLTGTTAIINAFFGDLDSFLPNDAGRFTIVSSPNLTSDSTGYGWNMTLSLFNAGIDVGKLYDVDGADWAGNYKFHNEYYNGENSTSNASGTSAGIEQSMEVFIINKQGGLSNDRLGVRIMNSVVAPRFRAKMPGMLNTIQATHADQVWPVMRNIDGVQYFMPAGYTVGRVWINTESWYD